MKGGPESKDTSPVARTADEIESDPFKLGETKGRMASPRLMYLRPGSELAQAKMDVLDRMKLDDPATRPPPGPPPTPREPPQGTKMYRSPDQDDPWIYEVTPDGSVTLTAAGVRKKIEGPQVQAILGQIKSGQLEPYYDLEQRPYVESEPTFSEKFSPEDQQRLGWLDPSSPR